MSATVETRPADHPAGHPRTHRTQPVHPPEDRRLPHHPAHLGAGPPVLLPGAVDDHHQLQDRRPGGLLPAPVPVHPHPGPLHRRVRAGHGAVSVELAVPRRRLHRGGDAARHPRRLRPVGTPDHPLAGWAVLLHLDQVHAGRGLDHPGLPAAADLRSAGQPVGARPALPRHQPSSRRVDDAVLLRRGPHRRGGSGSDRRGQLQS